MRPERITLNQAQRVYDNIVRHIKLTGWKGERLELPAIDMAAIFNGRKSMTHYHVLDAINKIIADTQA